MSRKLFVVIFIGITILGLTVFFGGCGSTTTDTTPIVTLKGGAV